MGHVHAAGEAVDVGMALSFCPKKAGATGEHDIGFPEQSIFTLQQLPRRVLESGQLIHAVVDDELRIQFVQQR